MKQLPHRHIGVIKATDPCGAFQLGSGILISKNLVLTCAHVTHCQAFQKRPFPKIYFYPAQYGELTHGYEIERTETPDEYKSKERWLFKKAYDYTLLKLRESVDEEDFLPLSEDLPQLDKGTTLAIYGYPESKYDKKDGKPKATKQYGLTRTGYILDIYESVGYMVHRIATEAGQSGAPVIKIDKNGRMMIVGIHVGTSEEKNEKYSKEFPNLVRPNLTKLIDRHMVKKLREFAHKLNGDDFRTGAVEHKGAQ